MPPGQQNPEPPVHASLPALEAQLPEPEPQQHTPEPQRSFRPQAFPHPPQFIGSESVSTQLEPQHSPEVHTSPPAPPQRHDPPTHDAPETEQVTAVPEHEPPEH